MDYLIKTMKIKAAVSLLMLIWTDLAWVAAQDQTYMYHRHNVWWSPAQTFCECFGTLARLDTLEEFNHFRTQINIPSGKCAWIGAASYNNQRQYRWVQIPPNYQSVFTTGPLVSSGYTNYISDHPVSSSTFHGVCIQHDYTWETIPHNTKSNLICEVPVCGPGKYYGRIAPTNVYCRAFYKKTRACVPCPDNKVKLVSGNSKSLCIDAAQACDGTITVVNSDRSECICNAGYFKNGDSCTMCSENTVKSSAGNATSCDTTCDGVRTVSNSARTACVCNAGYFGSGGTMCTLCTGNMTKPDVGDSATCDQVCDPESSRPNTDRTECDCLPGWRWVE